MDQGDPHGAVNMTRAQEAVFLYIKDARRTVVRIEIFVAVAVALVYLQLILGSFRRRSGHWSVQGTLWLAYTLSFPLVAYTFGQMISSPAKNGLYYVWGVLLFWATGCTNFITAYDLEDNKRWKRNIFELLQYVSYLSVIESLLSPQHANPFLDGYTNPIQYSQPIDKAVTLLYCIIFAAHMVRIIAGWMVTNSYPSKLVADYVKDQVQKRGDQDYSDPITMQDYKYIVRWRYNHPLPSYTKDGIVTIDTIWGMKFDDTKGVGSGLKDGLLPEKDGIKDCIRAFHIIEVELGFLHDFFYTKYAALFRTEISSLVLLVLKLISASICLAILLRHSPQIKTLDPVIEVGTRTVDVTITIMVIGSFILAEVLQAILYVISDWATVSVACSYSMSDTTRAYWKFILSLILFLRRLSLPSFFGYWQNKMGQSSVIGRKVYRTNATSLLVHRCISHIDDLLLTGMMHSYLYILEFMLRMLNSGKTFVLVPDLVKREIVSCLQKSSIGGPLTNGEAALKDNGVHGEFSWAINKPSQARIMAIWHVATEYCYTASSSKADGHQSVTEEEKVRIDNYQQVATTLSRYCAYMMSFAPDLLPGNSIDTKAVFDNVSLQAGRVLLRRKPTLDLLLKAIDDSKSSRNEDTIIHGNNTEDIIIHDTSSRSMHTIVGDSIGNNIEDTSIHNSNTNKEETMFIEGLELGRDLENIEDEVLRWKVLAEFWAETIIYIAPSENVKLHMESLAQGGEFLTHVWALLTHAGILKRGQKQAPQDMV